MIKQPVAESVGILWLRDACFTASYQMSVVEQTQTYYTYIYIHLKI